MDTVVLIVPSVDLVSEIRGALIEKPHLIVKSRTKDGKRLLARGYAYQIEGLYDGYHIYFAYEPFSKNKPPAIIQFHLSHFESMASVQVWLTDLFGAITSRISHECEIKRLDLCVDVAIPYEALTQSICLPGSRTFERWRSDGGRTLYLGDRPFRFRVYEKPGFSSSNIDYWPINIKKSDTDYVNATRIEAELLGRKVPIKMLSELVKVGTFQPFERLRLESLHVQTANLNSSHVVQHFLKRMQEVGYAPARKEFNVSGNFSKTIGRHIAPLDIDLKKIWQSRVARFFGAGDSSYA